MSSLTFKHDDINFHRCLQDKVSKICKNVLFSLFNAMHVSVRVRIGGKHIIRLMKSAIQV